MPMNVILRALAEPKRVEILKLIRNRELAAGAIAEKFAVTRPAISQHLRVLSEAGLVAERRDGTRRLYRLCPQGLMALRRFLAQFWDVQLASLKAAVEEEKGRRRKGGRRQRRQP